MKIEAVVEIMENSESKDRKAGEEGLSADCDLNKTKGFVLLIRNVEIETEEELKEEFAKYGKLRGVCIETDAER